VKTVAARIGLGLTLIVAVSALLLYSDSAQRRGARRLPRVAVLQFSSFPLIEEAVEGTIEGLKNKGFEHGKTVLIERFNAHGDLPTMNAIAHTVVDSRFDLVATLSTPALQAMAAANLESCIPHVFGAVTDPFACGVGLKREDPADHPPYLAGIGTFQPVRETLRLAKQLYPGLKVVGTVWNPAETCSEACVRLAKATVKELGIELLEANVENSSGVLEAANSLIARGVEALVLGGDNTVETAIPPVIQTAAQARIPVITYDSGWALRGALIGLGANYHTVGMTVGELAGDVLQGASLAKIPIVDTVPKKLGLNLTVLRGLRAPWRVPPEVLASADVGVDEKGVPWDRTATKTAGAPAKKWKIALIEQVDAPAIEESRKGVFAGLKEAGLVEGRDYEIRILNAQGDLAALPGLVDAAVTGGADMIYTITTPALQAAMNKVRDRPVLFTLALDPLLAGDEGTHGNHRSNVAGVFDRSPFEPMMELIRQCLPQARAIGTLFAPGEANSVNFRNELEKAARAAGLQLVAVASSSPSEVPDAALALTGRGIDAICQINDNLHDAAFPAIVDAARRARLPVFGFSAGQAEKGAALVLSNDHFDGGRESALIAAQVIRGASPASFPYRGIAKTRLVVNRKAAEAANMRIPEAILRRAEKVH